ncbi:FAD-dependent oxidoreductase [Aspergillus neoniger CBS 115656]|uniref:Monooxygenase n=1 Tax=Aspergillus neoniger (strain CBS 115656) TaxID=1448310 RepID=A0A318YD68_ASPNB|nr:monooxygenase [Aspergillus neoniger CBS 115656]PYH31537.1 monooxygenase [Aspergillus neoniger CBS 115656]
MADSESRFRVVIVGGSIAGLTLAHCLLRNNTDFVVLESHADIAPQVGASIGILPNGARILDQLGLYDDVLSQAEPLTRTFTHGYPVAFLDRQILLSILYEGLGDNRHRVMVNKKVTEIEHTPEKVMVHCADQSVYEGDLVVGADGVRSTVRRQMWQYMESRGMEHEALKEKNLMTSEYNCVFGISSATPGLRPGHGHRTFAEGYSILTIIGKEGRVYWFFFTRMDQTYPASQIPRFSQDEIDSHLAPYLQKPITPDVSLSEINKRAIVRTFVSLEEAVYSHWCVDRYVCIGDSAHKMTPNLGQGGNNLQDIHQCLQIWQNIRQKRLDHISQSAYDLTRIEALAGLKKKIIGLYLLPYLSQYLVDQTSATIVGAANIDGLPLPPKSLACTMPYLDDKNSVSKQDNEVCKRAISTVPFACCYAAAQKTMGTLINQTVPFMVSLFAEGVWSAANGEVLNLSRPLYHMPFLDKLFLPATTCFLPSISGSDPQSHTQMLSFMADIGPIYGIWLLESYRKAHSWYELVLPIGTGIASQLKGIGKFAPIYYTLEHIRLPLSSLLSGAKHQITQEASSSLLFAMLTGYYIPTIANFMAPTVESRRNYNAIWQMFPVVVPLLQAPLHRLVKRAFGSKKKPQQKEERKENMRYVRYAYGSFALISGLTFLHARCTAPAHTSSTSAFLPGLRGHLAPVTSFADGIARLLQYDEVISMASGFMWLALKFKELKDAGASFSWLKAVGGLVGTTVTLGPGATFALGWGWREEMMQKLVRDKQSSM